MLQENSARIFAERQQPDSAGLIRPGQGAPLFLFGGSGAYLEELDKLAASLRTTRPLIAVPYWQAGDDGAGPTSVEAMAAVARDLIRAHRTDGRYMLAGYSLGGFVALEAARLLMSEGGVVAPPILIDSIPHRSYWPKSALLRAALGHGSKRLPHSRRTMRLTGAATSHEPDRRCQAAYCNYRPGRYPGRVHLLSASEEASHARSARSIWKGLAMDIHHHSIAARHLDIIQADDAVETVAKIIDAIVDAPRHASDARTALILTGLLWPQTARLADAMIQTGFFVDAIAPAYHPLANVQGIGTLYPLSGVHPKHAIEAAIIDSRPDALVPVDDFVTCLLHDIHRTTKDSGVRATIERSLGDPEFYDVKYNRSWINDMARCHGVETPRTASLSSEASIAEALAQTGLPAFIKTDGKWGGTGVRRVETVTEARRRWRELRRSSGILRGIKRAQLNGDVSSIGEAFAPRNPVLSVQEEIRGQLIIVSAVCRDGKLLGMTSARVIAQRRLYGPATLIAPEESSKLRGPVSRIVSALRLSGFCGFDFIVSDDGGKAYLIELNPRATPTCDLLFDQDDDLLCNYMESIGGRPKPRGGHYPRSAHFDNSALCKKPSIVELTGRAVAFVTEGLHHSLRRTRRIG